MVAQVDGARYTPGAGGSGVWTFPSYAAGAVSRLCSKRWALEVPAGLAALVRRQAEHAVATGSSTVDGPFGAAMRAFRL